MKVLTLFVLCYNIEAKNFLLFHIFETGESFPTSLLHADTSVL